MSYKSWTCLFLVYLAGAIPASAKPKVQSSNKPRPIEMKMDISPLGSKVGYFLAGKNVNHYRDLKDIILPLNDPASTRQIMGAEDADTWSWGFFITAMAGGVGTAVLVPPMVVFRDDFFDRVSTGAFVAQFPGFFGTVFQFAAENQKFNAVQRYNQVVRDETPLALKVTPQLYANKGVLGLGLNCAF